jgi:ribosomal protein S18 acetylase RimI-like enzyme
VKSDDIALRPITPEDESFLFEVYASTRADEMKLVPWSEAQQEEFLRMQFAAQHKYYQSEYPAADYQIILLHHRSIGRLYVDRRASEIRILDVTLLPEYRNRGIGTPLIQALIDEGKNTGKAVGIYVDNFGVAASFFERLGFSKVENNGMNSLFVHNSSN